MALLSSPDAEIVTRQAFTLSPVGMSFDPSISFEEWEGVGAQLQQMERGVMWWIGDWIRFGERKWGEKYAQAIEVTGKSYSALANAKWVAEQFDFSLRSEKLPWYAHREIAALPTEGRAEVLALAESEGWTVRETRAYVNRVKNAGALGIADLPIGGGCTIADLQAVAQSGRKYGTIYADPPWQYDNQGTRAATGNHYHGMSVEEICALPIADMAADTAHLHLWTTSGFLPDAFRIIEAWGFVYKSSFVWVKPEMGIGNYWRLSHEFLLLGVRGNLRFAHRGLKSWLECGRGPHSAKPEQVRSFIMAASPGPYLEMFGRRPVEGWDTYGDQIEPRHLFTGKVEVL